MAKLIEVEGNERVENQFAIIATFNPEESDKIIGNHAKNEQRELRKTPYPSRLPHFSHERKRYFGGIAGSFSARRLGPGRWTVVNSRPYAQYVIGSRQRSHPSFSRWWLMGDEMEKRMPILLKKLGRELDKDLEAA